MLAKISFQIIGIGLVLLGLIASQSSATETFLLPCGVSLLAWAQLKLDKIKN